MITIVDYGLGNINAFLNVYRRLNIEARTATWNQGGYFQDGWPRGLWKVQNDRPWNANFFTSLTCSACCLQARRAKRWRR